jgi:MEMO1 family protein
VLTLLFSRDYSDLVVPATFNHPCHLSDDSTFTENLSLTFFGASYSQQEMGSVPSKKETRNQPHNTNNSNNSTSTMSTPSYTPYKRRAHHAGSWYSADSTILHDQLTNFLTTAAAATSTTTTTDDDDDHDTSTRPLRSVVVPHAGYSYSGPTAGYSYHAVQQELARPHSPIRHIIVFHPSHHVSMAHCAVSGATVLETPLGPLEVDEELREEILQLATTTATTTTNNNSNSHHHPLTPISVMEQRVDEREHSGEMQYPFLKACLLASSSSSSTTTTATATTTTVKVLPFMCGNISTQQEQMYGQLLAPIVARPDVLCVVSSDFCHWGAHFSYRPTPPKGRTAAAAASSFNTIADFIRELDHQGMKPIELQQPGAFATYLKQTRNTICGRHAISVWLQAIDWNNKNPTTATTTAITTTYVDPVTIEFIKYAQSSRVQTMSDSSVSYAAAVARRREG